jgi:hypothetical protein
MIEQIAPIEYDICGRMKYNPDLHDRQGRPWEDDEKEYLINWYSKIGLEEMSLALGRTETTIATKVSIFRSQGKMSRELSSNVVRELRGERKAYKPKGRARKFNIDIEIILKLKETKSFREIAEMFGTSKALIEKRVYAYKKATQGPDQSTQSSIEKNSNLLYHTEGGMQVAN